MMDVAEALAKADMIKQGGKPYGDTAIRVIDTLAAEVRRLQPDAEKYRAWITASVEERRELRRVLHEQVAAAEAAREGRGT